MLSQSASSQYNMVEVQTEGSRREYEDEMEADTTPNSCWTVAGTGDDHWACSMRPWDLLITRKERDASSPVAWVLMKVSLLLQNLPEPILEVDCPDTKSCHQQKKLGPLLTKGN